MKTVLTEIPDAPGELATWLEEKLISPDFCGLVSELAALDQQQLPAVASFSSLSAEQIEQQTAQAVETGFIDALPAYISFLLRQPQRLVDLQQQIFERGSEYWLAKIEAGQDSTISDDLRKQITAVTTREPTQQPPTVLPAGQQQTEPDPKAPTSHFWRNLLTLAAGLLFTAGIVYILSNLLISTSDQQVVAWGWLEDDLDLQELSAKQYLESLARGADDWFAKRPTDSAGIKNRLQEFKQGCQQLLATEHRPLGGSDKAWLELRLGDCLREVELQLARLDEPQIDPLRVRSAVDELVREVAHELRERAANIG